MRPLVLIVLRLYRWFLSPLKTGLFGPGAGCRHVPSCSAFAEEAVQRHGLRRGGWLAVRRLCRCHPWGTSGFDPVPKVLPQRPWPAVPKARRRAVGV